MALLHLGDEERGALWKEVFAREMPEVDFRCWPNVGRADDIRYLVAWTVTEEQIASLPNLEILFSVGAGVDQLDLSRIPDHVRVVRMIESGITNTMAEYVTMAALALHRDMPFYLDAQRSGQWNPRDVLLCSERSVGFMGLGEMARASIARLAPLGFDLRGWSRRPTNIQGVTTFAGKADFDAFLGDTDILICLLPLTEDTRGILCRDLFAMLPKGASVINVARGGHLVEPDLLDALESGQLCYAFLDVCDPEPLPSDHPFHSHPSIFLTPHIAGVTRKETAVHSLIANVRRELEGLPLDGEVNRRRGY